MVPLKRCQQAVWILAVMLSVAPVPVAAQQYEFEYGVSFKTALATARTQVREDLAQKRRNINKYYYAEKEKVMNAYRDRVRGLALAETTFFKSENRKELEDLKSLRDSALADATHQAKVELAFRESELRRVYGISENDL